MNPTQPTPPADAAPEASAPKPTFDALPLTAEVKKALDEMGYQHPTPVQIACYDPAIRGKDLKVQARTGTGKTTAFGLPLVDQLVRKTGGLQALALCPTRELALQVAAEIAKLGKHKGIKVCAVYGGAPMGRQIAELEEGAQVVVGTPGRVLDHLRRGTMDPKGLRVFILDEADEMLSMGFEKELHHIVEKLPASRQTMLFSATLSNDVGRLARNMKDPETILLSGDQVGALELTHYFYMQQGDKIRDLLRILEVEDPTSAILFCNTKDDTERTAKELRRAGFAADYLSGDLDQKEREKVMNAVREGKLRFLVATDVAARGIDISHLTHVINVDFPEAAEQYVHRTGRTGRAGRTGTAISLINAKNVGNLYYLRLTYGLKPIERSLPSDQEVATRREADLVERVAVKARTLGPDADAHAVARRLLTRDDADLLVASLLRESLGSQLVAADEAARARRARNPPPVVEPPPTTKAEPRPAMRAARPASPPVSAQVAIAGDVAVDSDAITSRQGRERGDRGERGERGGRERPPTRAGERDRGVDRSIDRNRPEPVRAPHSQLVEWAPPAEADDERPLIRRAAGEPADARADAPRPAARPDRPARPERVPSEAREPREPREPREAREPRESREAREEREDAERPTLPQIRTVFLNSGRRDGLRTADVLKLLEERASIPAEAVGRVRIRDRNSFVDVRPEVVDRAVDGLKGASFGGRTLNAEIARPREEGAAGDPADERATTQPMGRVR